MTNLDEEDRTYFDGHFDKIYKRQNETDKEVTKNTTDITWLKRFHAAEVMVVISVISGLILWAVFGGG